MRIRVSVIPVQESFRIDIILRPQHLHVFMSIGYLWPNFEHQGFPFAAVWKYIFSAILQYFVTIKRNDHHVRKGHALIHVFHLFLQIIREQIYRIKQFNKIGNSVER